MKKSYFWGSTGTPEYPTAQTILPQFASCPKNAVFTKHDFEIEVATWRPSSKVLAPF